jgi:hypothetical protein
MADNILTQDCLHKLFDYKDGNLYWKEDNRAKKIKGMIAGYITKNGYRAIRKNGKFYLAHRLIFLYHYGHLPKFIDHIDRNRQNNKIENLRECSLQQSAFNRLPPQKSTSGFRNVTKNKEKWQVHLNFKNKCMYFGSFDNIELADLVAQEARDKYHKEFKTNEIKK